MYKTAFLFVTIITLNLTVSACCDDQVYTNTEVEPDPDTSLDYDAGNVVQPDMVEDPPMGERLYLELALGTEPRLAINDEMVVVTYKDGGFLNYLVIDIATGDILDQQQPISTDGGRYTNILFLKRSNNDIIMMLNEPEREEEDDLTEIYRWQGSDPVPQKSHNADIKAISVTNDGEDDYALVYFSSDQSIYICRIDAELITDDCVDKNSFRGNEYNELLDLSFSNDHFAFAYAFSNIDEAYGVLAVDSEEPGETDFLIDYFAITRLNMRSLAFRDGFIVQSTITGFKGGWSHSFFQVDIDGQGSEISPYPRMLALSFAVMDDEIIFLGEKLGEVSENVLFLERDYVAIPMENIKREEINRDFPPYLDATDTVAAIIWNESQETETLIKLEIIPAAEFE